MLGATRKNIYDYPSYSQGYGVVDFRATIQKISDNL
jgi:hypothetical protein